MTIIRWHYTVGARLAAILGDRAIRPATAGVRLPEIPVVWFTESPQWEQTANKNLLEPGGGLRFLDRGETARVGGGLIRIGVSPASAPRPYRDLSKIARATAATVHHLTRVAKSKGSLVGLWYFSVVPITDDAWIAIEGYDGTGWHSIAQKHPA